MNSEKKITGTDKLSNDLEAERMKRHCLETQFDSLKSQINPHFMFNSFNSLLLLIAEDSRKAEHFVHQMSAVYRYLLQKNEQPLISLSEELEFIRSYFYLLKTRFKGLSEDISVQEKHLDWKLAPMTLQLLVENAMRHNVVSAARPLTIKIFTTADELVVENNLQRKASIIESAKKSLQNLVCKYQLHKKEIIIKETASKFEVRIPLMQEEE